MAHGRSPFDFGTESNYRRVYMSCEYAGRNAAKRARMAVRFDTKRKDPISGRRFPSRRSRAQVTLEFRQVATERMEKEEERTDPLAPSFSKSHPREFG